jgi:hypothetical protein
LIMSEQTKNCFINKGAWPNGKALDYESRDCRFDPCRAHLLFCLP